MQPTSQRLWRPKKTVIPIDTPRWAQQLGISELVCQLLAQRGVTDLDAAGVFLSGTLAALPDPFLLDGMTAAVQRLVAAISAGETIAVHGDYDVDGITATALLCEALSWFGAVVEYHIPLRTRDGYGLSEQAIRRAAQSGVQLIVSVDCGISALLEADLAAQLGIDLIITDHHQPLDRLPVAVARINPWLAACRYPDKKLSGVGVAFMLSLALRSALRHSGHLAVPEPDVRYLLDLVAMGTIADLVPLSGINRILVKAGLRLLERGQRPGVVALKQIADVKQVSAGAVGFKLAPRLNAAGRLEDAALGVELLLCQDSRQATQMASQLNDFNQQRQTIEQQVLDQAIERISKELAQEQFTIVLADERWHAGVIGIVASRLVERFHRPTVLIAIDHGVGKGSARSIAGFHLFKSFQHCAALLGGFGGHEFAAGLSIDPQRVPEFAQSFEQYARQRLSAPDLVALRNYDAEVLLHHLDRTFYDELQALAPFGAGNPEPLLLCRGVEVFQPTVVGTKHVRFVVRQAGVSHPCIAFSFGDRLAEFDGEVDVLFQLTLNSWRDRETLQLNIKDIRAVDVATA